MLAIDILCVGKSKQPGLAELFADYFSRLKFFCKIKVVEVSKWKNFSSVDVARCLQFEEINILKKLDLSSFIIALCVEGVELSSEEFAGKIFKIQNLGFSKISFIVGGAFGLSEGVKNKANFRMSFSKMTLPHKLARLFLVEQIYRAMTILNKVPYHK